MDLNLNATGAIENWTELLNYDKFFKVCLNVLKIGSHLGFEGQKYVKSYKQHKK